MPMLNRFNRLFRADVHGLLDRIEEPQLMLRQALREMQEALTDAERQLAARRTRLQQQQRRQEEIRASLLKIIEELPLCFEANNDELARVLLRRRLEGERLLAHLERQSARLVAETAQAEQALVAQRHQFEALQQQAEAQVGDGDTAEATPSWSAEQFRVSDADVELALLRERRRTA